MSTGNSNDRKNTGKSSGKGKAQVENANYINQVLGSKNKGSDSPNASRWKSQVTLVKNVTQWPDEDIIRVLEEVNGDTETAINNILDGSAGTPSTKWKEVPKKQPKEPKPSGESSKQAEKKDQAFFDRWKDGSDNKAQSSGGGSVQRVASGDGPRRGGAGNAGAQRSKGQGGQGRPPRQQQPSTSAPTAGHIAAESAKENGHATPSAVAAAPPRSWGPSSTASSSPTVNNNANAQPQVTKPTSEGSTGKVGTGSPTLPSTAPTTTIPAAAKAGIATQWSKALNFKTPEPPVTQQPLASVASKPSPQPQQAQPGAIGTVPAQLSSAKSTTAPSFSAIASGAASTTTAAPSPQSTPSFPSQTTTSASPLAQQSQPQQPQASQAPQLPQQAQQQSASSVLSSPQPASSQQTQQQTASYQAAANKKWKPKGESTSGSPSASPSLTPAVASHEQQQQLPQSGPAAVSTHKPTVSSISGSAPSGLVGTATAPTSYTTQSLQGGVVLPPNALHSIDSSNNIVDHLHFGSIPLSSNAPIPSSASSATVAQTTTATPSSAPSTSATPSTPSTVPPSSSSVESAQQQRTSPSYGKPGGTGSYGKDVSSHYGDTTHQQQQQAGMMYDHQVHPQQPSPFQRQVAAMHHPMGLVDPSGMSGMTGMPGLLAPLGMGLPGAPLMSGVDADQMSAAAAAAAAAGYPPYLFPHPLAHHPAAHGMYAAPPYYPMMDPSLVQMYGDPQHYMPYQPPSSLSPPLPGADQAQQSATSSSKYGGSGASGSRGASSTGSAYRTTTSGTASNTAPSSSGTSSTSPSSPSPTSQSESQPVTVGGYGAFAGYSAPGTGAPAYGGAPGMSPYGYAPHHHHPSAAPGAHHQYGALPGNASTAPTTAATAPGTVATPASQTATPYGSGSPGAAHHHPHAQYYPPAGPGRYYGRQPFGASPAPSAAAPASAAPYSGYYGAAPAGGSDDLLSQQGTQPQDPYSKSFPYYGAQQPSGSGQGDGSKTSSQDNTGGGQGAAVSDYKGSHHSYYNMMAQQQSYDPQPYGSSYSSHQQRQHQQYMPKQQ